MNNFKKTKQLQIKTTKIEWLKIIDLILNRQEWGTTYVLYEYKDVIIKCFIESINFQKNIANIRVVCNYKTKLYFCSWYNEKTIEYFLNNFSVNEFETLLNKKILSLCDELIGREAREEAHNKYSDLEYCNDDITTSDIENSVYSDDYEQAQNLSSEYERMITSEITDEILKEKNREYHKKVDDYCRNYKMEHSELQNFHKILENNCGCRS